MRWWPSSQSTAWADSIWCAYSSGYASSKAIAGDSQRQRRGVLGKAMPTWPHHKRVTLRLIEPGKPNQNVYAESFNGRLRDECMNEHWFTGLTHARVVTETWRREYDERPKKVLAGLTPAATPEDERLRSTWSAVAGIFATQINDLERRGGLNPDP